MTALGKYVKARAGDLFEQQERTIEWHHPVLAAPDDERFMRKLIQRFAPEFFQR
jgi:hypothetical protein